MGSEYSQILTQCVCEVVTVQKPSWWVVHSHQVFDEWSVLCVGRVGDRHRDTGYELFFVLFCFLRINSYVYMTMIVIMIAALLVASIVATYSKGGTI